MSEIDIFVSPTGVVTLDHMRKLNDIALVGTDPVSLAPQVQRYLACGAPFLRYAEFSRHTFGASVYGALEEAQTASAWHFSPERHEVRRLPVAPMPFM